LRGVVVACVCAGAVGWAAGPALADGTDPGYPGSVLHVSASGPLTPGSVLTITATGTNVEPQSVYGMSTSNFALTIYLVSVDQLPGPCPDNVEKEGAIALDNATYVKNETIRPLNEGYGGPFTIPLPVTLNNGTGHLMICAYSTYGFGDDAAWASTEVTISAGAPIPASQFPSRRVTLGSTGGCWPLATTQRELMQGLDGLRHPARPMVFAFQPARSQIFTSQHVLVPVTFVWIGRGKTVIGRRHAAPGSVATYSPPAPVTAVVEYPAGWRVPPDGARIQVGGRCSSSAGL